MSHNDFAKRHIGPGEDDIRTMCDDLGVSSPQEILEKTIPKGIFRPNALTHLTGDPLDEHQALKKLKGYFAANHHYRHFIGMGYHPTKTPTALQKYLFENPGWYTPYTPYQAEISQGRLEMLFLYQTLCSELTGLPLANASLLDEGTAAAEAMTLSYAKRHHKSHSTYLVPRQTYPQTLAVLASRAHSLGIRLRLWDMDTYDPQSFKQLLGDSSCFGALFCYPDSTGEVRDLTPMILALGEYGGISACATDLLSLTLLKTPKDMGVDIAFGSSQRLGVPMGYGGPHAAFFTCTMDFLRSLPGRVVGRSIDRLGSPAYRLALQTREQHIRREKATSNICTAQALLASMATGYGVYHGKSGLISIARQILCQTKAAHQWLTTSGFKPINKTYFDTLRIPVTKNILKNIESRAQEKRINLYLKEGSSECYCQFSCNETTTTDDLNDLLYTITGKIPQKLYHEIHLTQTKEDLIPKAMARNHEFLQQEIFQKPPSELQFLRWLKRLENKDLSLTHSMIPLGSCTMKLNGASELLPLSWPELQDAHPRQPDDQVSGYLKMTSDLAHYLGQITGLHTVSLQPNSGAQGELAGLMAIASYHKSRGHGHRNICFVPASAHGTNPASSVMAGMKVVVIPTDCHGNVDMAALSQNIERYHDQLACLMVTYPSTHGVFEQGIAKICDLIHQAGGQVYLDGANLNAQIGYCLPGEYGVDVCHMNLHKTFCIPHGGGGPGAGPIAVAEHLVPHLPKDPYTLGEQFLATGYLNDQYSVSSAHLGSPYILCISWMYIT
ncbi:MAG: aminomethyl-transferring glycine dehydrogenase [Proteobacteria bacterium]|nr:aminomethyl-transferring glycine dehydrogenase [Pseudomonadota bacterium]